MRIKSIGYMFVSAIFALSCTSKNTVYIDGNFENMGGEKILIEKKYTDHTLFLDSVRLDKNGAFSQRLNVRSAEPAFISIKDKNGKQLLMLLAENGEKIKLNCTGGKYIIDGSKGSQLVQQLDLHLGKTAARLDSLSKVMGAENVAQPDYDNARIAISKTFIEQKRSNIKFIVSNPKSYASIFALYQQLPNGTRIFGDPSDFMIYKILVDSMDVNYAKSDYMQLVRRDYKELQRIADLNNKMAHDTIAEIGFPEIELPNRKSQMEKLSALKGNVILLVFWASTTEGSKLDNKELIDLYAKYHNKGFEIYQISLDTDRNTWLRALDAQELSWINVCDFSGTNCPALPLYNVRAIPSNFIINKAGDIVARDLFDTDLDKKISSLL